MIFLVILDLCFFLLYFQNSFCFLVEIGFLAYLRLCKAPREENFSNIILGLSKTLGKLQYYYFRLIKNSVSLSLTSETMSRGVHGSVRFGLDSKNQPNRISVCVINSNRTGPETGSNRTGPVRLNPVFFGKNRET